MGSQKLRTMRSLTVTRRTLTLVMMMMSPLRRKESRTLQNQKLPPPSSVDLPNLVPRFSEEAHHPAPSLVVLLPPTIPSKLVEICSRHHKVSLCLELPQHLQASLV